MDANQRFIVLMTPVVNGDTPTAVCNASGYVAGFFDTEDFVGPSKHAARGFRRVVEGLAHADVLGALSGEYEGHRPIAVWRRRRVGGQATDTFPFT